MKAKLLLITVLMLGLQQNIFSLCSDNSNISLIYKKSSASEVRLFDVDYSTYRAKYDNLWGKGYRLKELDVRTIYGTTSYSAVWTKSTSSEIQYYGITDSEFKSIVAEKWDDGWRIFLVANYVDASNTLRYTVVFRPGTSSETYVTKATRDQFVSKYNTKNAEGYRLKEMEMFKYNGVVYYTGIFHKSSVSEYGILEWNYSDFLSSYKSLTGSGWRLSTLDSYYNSSSEQFYYTAFFRKETSSDAYVFGYGLYDFETKIEDQWYDAGYNIQFMTLAGREEGCNDVILNPVPGARTGEDMEMEVASDATGNAESELFVNVSPNPSTDGQFNLSSTLFEQEDGTVEILKMDGSTVLKKTVQMNGFNAALDLGELEPGIYIMNIIFGEMVLPKKIVIQ